MKMNRFWMVMGLVSCLLASCGGHWQSVEMKPDGGCWESGDTLKLSFESKDSVNACALGFPLTVSGDYPFNNIYLQATLRSPSGDQAVIPAEFVLADPTGAWQTEANGDLATFQLNVGDAIIFKESGLYTVSLVHFMRDRQLCGVDRVGISVDPLPSK